MKTTVTASWSTHTGRDMGAALRNGLPSHLPALQPARPTLVPFPLLYSSIILICPMRRVGNLWEIAGPLEMIFIGLGPVGRWAGGQVRLVRVW